MKTEVQGRLAQSLHNSVWLTLGLERQDYRVQRPWSATIAQKSKQPIPLDSGTKIVTVFDRADLDRQLLILGEPGAGKTTMMLELAEDLVKRALVDNSQPIPVLLSLSSWRDPKLSIFEWMAVELKAKYGLRVDLAKQWLIEKRVLPLLDGLDEVATERQRDCAVALNGWLTGDLEQRPCGVLICCRREEFEQVVGEPLSLYGAIYLQALTIGQIEDYFARFGLADVWETVRGDEALRELLTTPLFLSMFGLVQVQGTFELAGWTARESSKQKIEYLFDTYWEAAMSRKLIIDPEDKRHSKTYGMKNPPSLTTVKRYLIFIARALEKESEIDFMIERIQPSQILNAGKRNIYISLYLISLSILYTLPIKIHSIFKAEESSIFLRTFYTLFLTFPILKYLLETNVIIKPTGKLNFANLLDLQEWSGFFKLTLSIFSSALIIFSWLANGMDNLLKYLIATILVTISGVLINRSVRFLIDVMREEISETLIANQELKQTWENIPVFASFMLLFIFILMLRFSVGIAALVGSGGIPFQFFLAYIVYIIIISVFEGGGNALLKHVILRIVLAANRYAPFRYDLLLNYCTERLLLQRIGGRYWFMHKTLQDYFAKMELD